MHISAGDSVMAVHEVGFCKALIYSSTLMVVGEPLLDIEGKTLGAVDHAYLKGNVAERIKRQRMNSEGIHQQSVRSILFIVEHIIKQHAFHAQSIVGTPDAVHGLRGMIVGFS